MNAPAVEAERSALALGTSAPLAPHAAQYELDFDFPTTLPRDHPAWMRDALSVSARARALLLAFRPVAVRVLSFWDHQARAIGVLGRRLSVDPSGCYQLD